MKITHTTIQPQPTTFIRQTLTDHHTPLFLSIGIVTTVNLGVRPESTFASIAETKAQPMFWVTIECSFVRIIFLFEAQAIAGVQRPSAMLPSAL